MWVLETKLWTLARTGRTIFPAPTPSTHTVTVLKPAAGGKAFSSLCLVPRDPFRGSCFSHGSLFHKDDERARSRDCGQDPGGGGALESNLGSDIPSLLWNPILQELITRYSPHSGRGLHTDRNARRWGD